MAEGEILQPAPSPAEKVQPTPERREDPLRRIEKYAHRMFPVLVRNPEYRDILRWERERQEQESVETRPSADELIDLRCFWAVEFYLPSHVEKLLEGFAALGWDKPGRQFPDKNPSQWVRRLRETGHGGGWFPLHVIRRPGERRFFRQDYTAPLPSQAEYAVGAIYGLTSSITCIVMGFVLYEDYARCMDDALRRRYETYLEPYGRGYRIWGPRNQKDKAIKSIRTEMRQVARGWFRENLPGLFSTDILDGEMPTCEFMTLRQREPFPKRENDTRAEEYMSLLDIDHDIDTWHCEEIPGLKFAWPLMRDDKNRFHAVLAANENAFDPEKLRSYGGGGRLGCVLYVNNRIQGLISRWALLAVLAGFERHLNIVRDSPTFKLQRRRPMRILKALGDLVSHSVDISAVSTELAHFTERRGSFLHEVWGFKPSNQRYYKDNDISVGEGIRRSIGERTRRLRNADRSVRDLLMQYGTVLSAKENIRLQTTVKWLTWVILALTAVMAYQGVATAFDWPDLPRLLKQLLTKLHDMP